MKPFAFELNQIVVITASGETGTVTGRAEYTACENNYYVRYKAGDGRAVEVWWAESALHAA